MYYIYIYIICIFLCVIIGFLIKINHDEVNRNCKSTIFRLQIYVFYFISEKSLEYCKHFNLYYWINFDKCRDFLFLTLKLHDFHCHFHKFISLVVENSILKHFTYVIGRISGSLSPFLINFLFFLATFISESRSLLIFYHDLSLFLIILFLYIKCFMNKFVAEEL